MPVSESFMSEHLRGRLEVFGFADLLQWMELNRRSGRLALAQARDRRIVDWRSGQIVYVSGSLPRHRLGVHLLRSGALPAATLYELLARNFTSGVNLSKLILDGGHDSHDGLSLRVEELARTLLFEMFKWRHASFEYDPDFQVQPILRIGLSLRGQALAFHGAKNLDDTARRRHRNGKTEDSRAPDFPSEPEDLEARFWELLSSLDGPLDPEDGHRWHRSFRKLSQRVRECGIGPVTMPPVHEDTANMLLELLKKSPLDLPSVVRIAALDPYLTLDLLILANALSVDRENAVGTVPDAITRLGARAVTVLIDRLSALDFERVPEGDSAARALRRASVAAAVGAGRYSERYGMTRERGYTLGLLHTIAYADMFEIVGAIDFPPGPFRAAALEFFRPILGVARAEIWSLPLDFQAVISDDGADPSAAASLVRTARAAVPDCAIGTLGSESVDPLWCEEIENEVKMVFEFLGLGPVEIKSS